MTTICNCKVKFIRPEYKNLKDWMEDNNNIYIGRRGVVFIDGERFPKQNSIFANPFKINKNNSRKSVLFKYKIYILNKLKNKNFKNEFIALKGKNLGCWCKPEKCHGDILIELLNKY